MPNGVLHVSDRQKIDSIISKFIIIESESLFLVDNVSFEAQSRKKGNGMAMSPDIMRMTCGSSKIPRSLAVVVCKDQSLLSSRKDPFPRSPLSA